MKRNPSATSNGTFQPRCSHQASATKAPITTSSGGVCNTHRMPPISISSTQLSQSKTGSPASFSQSKNRLANLPMGILLSVSQSIPSPYRRTSSAVPAQP